MSLMQLIKKYDAQVQRDFEDLNREIAELTDQNQKLLDQVVQGVQTSDRMKLDLILNGCLVHPNEQRERVTIDRKLVLRAISTIESYGQLWDKIHPPTGDDNSIYKLAQDLSRAIEVPKDPNETGDR